MKALTYQASTSTAIAAGMMSAWRSNAAMSKPSSEHSVSQHKPRARADLRHTHHTDVCSLPRALSYVRLFNLVIQVKSPADGGWRVFHNI